MLVSTEEKNGSLQIYVVNDTFEIIKDSLSLKLMDFDGNVIFEKQLPAKSPANSSEVVFSIPLKKLEFDRKSSVLKVNFGNSEYLHYFTGPKDLKLPETETEIETEIKKVDTGFLITLSSKTLQKDVFLTPNEKGRFKDNFFDLLPNEPKTILFSTESKTAPKLRIKTLNHFIE